MAHSMISRIALPLCCLVACSGDESPVDRTYGSSRIVQQVGPEGGTLRGPGGSALQGFSLVILRSVARAEGATPCAALAAIRKTILKSLPKGYEEGMQYGMIGVQCMQTCITSIAVWIFGSMHTN